MRYWIIISLVFMLTAASCGAASTPSRQPVTLTDLQTAETKFDQLALSLVEAWNSRDGQSVKNLFTDEAEARDRSYGDHMVGPDQIAGLIAVVSAFGLDWKVQQTDRYIGMDNGLAVDELWNLKFGSVQYTQDHPMMEVDWLQTRDDLISNWTILYDLDTLEELDVPTSQRLKNAKSLLSAYQSAWSSGDELAVGELYASDAVRADTIFMEQQEGQVAITAFANSFFAWYPDVKWSLSFSFGEGMGDAPITGGLYTIKVTDLSGQPCEVKAAVLLQASENLISHETLYYEPESLISCGWAQ